MKSEKQPHSIFFVNHDLKLVHGKMITGRVLQRLKNNRILVEINGKAIIANSDLLFKKGTTFKAKIKIVKNGVSLKIDSYFELS